MTPEAIAPEWLQGEQIDEEAFVDAYLATHPMKCVGGRLFTVDGPVEEEESIRSDIYFMIRDYKKSGASKHAAALLDTIRTAAYSEPLPIQQDRIHVANGTYFLGDGFVPHKEFCMPDELRKTIDYAGNPDKTERMMFVSALNCPRQRAYERMTDTKRRFGKLGGNTPERR